LAAIDLRQERRVLRRLGPVPRADQLLREERENDDDQDWKCSALEESAHGEFTPLVKPKRSSGVAG
jgi:hypothetical protein